MMEDNKPNLMPSDPWQEPGAAGRALNRPAEPPAGQWEAIEARMRRDRGRRGFFWLWPLGLLLLGGLGWYGLNRFDADSGMRPVAHQDSQEARSASASKSNQGYQLQSESAQSKIQSADQTPVPKATQTTVSIEPNDAIPLPAVAASDEPSGHSVKVHTIRPEKPRRSHFSDWNRTIAGTVIATNQATPKTKPANEGGNSEQANPIGKPLSADATVPVKKSIAHTSVPVLKNPIPVLAERMEKGGSREESFSESSLSKSIEGTHSEAIQSPSSIQSPSANDIVGVADEQARKEPEGNSSSASQPNADPMAATTDSAMTDVAKNLPIDPLPIDSTPNGVTPDQPRRDRANRFCFGLAGLTFGDRTRVASYPEMAQRQYRLTSLGASWGGLAKVGYGLPLNVHWSLLGEGNLGFLVRQGRYRIQPGGGAAFTVVAQDSTGYTAQPVAITEAAFHQQTGLAGVVLQLQYHLGPVSLSAGGRVLGCLALNRDGLNGVTIQPMAGAAFRLRPRLSLEATGQPFRIGKSALPLPLDSRSAGGLYSLGLLWRLK